MEVSMDPDIVDNARYSSRKFWITIIAMGLMAFGGVIAAVWSAFANNYGTFVTGIGGALTVYLTGNVAQRWVHGNATGPVAHAAASNMKSEEEDPAIK